MNYHEMSSAQNSNYRKSGFLLAGITAVIYVVLFSRGNNQPYLVVAAIVLAIASFFEAKPLRKAIGLFISVGNFMHRFTNPLVFGLIYVIAVIPTGFVLKLLGKDELQRCFDSKLPTYWKDHVGGKAWKKTFRKQF
ncbi:MAG: hypothetical protein PHF56_18000 [Desulfuromonadaceae bacterium]|nr:hypothetical protein [Desulfuromonadaceae bacterium]